MTGSLWDFSLATYKRPGVQAACLNLQDNIGADVNLLLYCCWRGAMEKGEMAALTAELAPWQADVVGRLRTVRRIMKPMVKALAEQSEEAAKLRKKVAGVELEAEKLQQSMMMCFAAGHETTAPPSPGAAAQNMAQYLNILPKPPGGAAMEKLETILAASFPKSNMDSIDSAMTDLRTKFRFTDS